MMRVTLNPEVLRWARERAGRTVQDLAAPFPKLDRWERGEERPTLKQVERFAKAVHAPVGYLFLPEPPVESVPIPDFRTAGNVHSGHPSPDLLDTIYICQQRQEWYRDFARSVGEGPLAFVGSANVGSDVVSTAATIRHALGFDMEERRRMPTWTDALRRFIEQADALGILVMCSGVVLNNNRRHLDPEEFRGFAMADDLAPLVFINGADTKAAQMFTLAHELAHIWLGQSAVSDAQALLLPEHGSRALVQPGCGRAARAARCSARRVRPRPPSWATRSAAWRGASRSARWSSCAGSTTRAGSRAKSSGRRTSRSLQRLRAIPKGSGGDFYLTQAARVSKRFARALVVSTLEGQTLHRDAFRMLGFSKLQTFHELGRSLGVMI